MRLPAVTAATAGAVVAALLLGKAVVADAQPAATATAPAGAATAPPQRDDADPPGADQGRIVGTVVDDRTGEPLIDAAVEVVGTGVTVRTDLDGRYVAVVPAGRYTVRAYYPLYTAERAGEVRVRAGRERTVDFALAPETAAVVEEVVVVARAERQTEAAQLLQRQRSATVSDTISAQEMSRSGAGTASEAARRVTGASVVDDRYVYVRGLGERYGHTLFNGVPLPSPEPDRRVVPLDIFPAGLLESFQIIKTASPDLPADFAGGSSQIATRQFPDRFVLRTGLSLGVNTQATFQELGLPDFQRLDWLAFDDGTRDILAALPDDQVFQGHELPDGSTMTAEQVEAWGEALHNDFSPDFRTAWPDLSLSASVGDTLHPGGRRLGYALSLNYSNKLRDVLEIERSFSLADVDRDGDTVPEGRELVPRSDYAGERAGNGVLWGLLGSTAYEMADGHETSFDLLYTRKADNDALRLEGKDPDEVLPVRYDRLRYVSRSLLLAQLRGRDEFRNGFDTDLRWQANVSRTDRSEPDTREVTYQRVDDGAGNVTYEYLVGTQSGAHFASALDELSGGGGLDWTLHLPRSGIPTALKLGGLAQYRDRRFAARRFRFLRERRADRDAFRLPPDELFSAAHIGPDLRLEESTRVDDTYDATQLLGAAYGLFDVVLFPGLRTIAGVRFEYSDQDVVTRNPYAAPGEPPVSAGLATWDIFPSVNLVYALREGMNLRCGVSQTTARPEFRELTPFAYFDFVGGQYVFGNPDLLPTRILNADLRWEWFPAPGEVLAVSAFYKSLTDPIEAIIVPTSELARSYQNAAGARVAGAEVEARVSLGYLADALDDFQLMANFTYVWSRIQLAAEQLGVQSTDDRPLQGQSPYVVNVGLDFQRPDWGTRIRLMYNVLGARIDQVGAMGLPDIYEEPRHLLDFTAEQELPEGFVLRLSAQNLLDQQVVYTQGDKTVTSFKPGVSLSLGVSWAW